MLFDFFLQKCDSCGKKAMVHLGKGVYTCAECGHIQIEGDPDDYDDNEGEGYSWEEIWEERPVECLCCNNDSGYPECIKHCANVSHMFKDW